MYLICKHFINNILLYIYKYVRTCIRKFKLLFFCTLLKTKIYLFVSIKYILIDHVLSKMHL